MNAPACLLRLYVAGDSPIFRRAVANFRKLAGHAHGGRCQLEVIDILRDPEAARLDNVWAVPMLVRVRPEPLREVVGDLSDERTVLAAIETGAA